MAITAFPFDDQDTTETQFSQWARELQDSGVADSASGTGLKVSGGGGGMAVQIQPGAALLRGHFFVSTAVETVTIAAAGTAQRYDRIVARINPSTNAGTLVALTGTAGSGIPTLTQTDSGIYEISLAIVTVQAAVTTIDAAMVADNRGFVGTRVRSWSSATRPSAPRMFQLGYNTTTAKWEWWNGSQYQSLSAATADVASQWNGYELIVSTSQPTVTPLANRIWIQPTS